MPPTLVLTPARVLADLRHSEQRWRLDRLGAIAVARAAMVDGLLTEREICAELNLGKGSLYRRFAELAGHLRREGNLDGLRALRLEALGRVDVDSRPPTRVNV